MTHAEHQAQTARVAASLATISYVGKPTIPAGMTVAEYRANRNANRSN